MKKLLFPFCFLAISFASCQKDQKNLSKVSSDRELKQIGSDDVNFDEIFNEADSFHNAFLAFTYSKIMDGSIDPTNINSLRPIDSLYFINNGLTSTQVSWVNNLIYPPILGDSMATFTQHVLASNSFYLSIDSSIKGVVNVSNMQSYSLDELENMLTQNLKT